MSETEPRGESEQPKFSGEFADEGSSPETPVVDDAQPDAAERAAAEARRQEEAVAAAQAAVDRAPTPAEAAEPAGAPVEAVPPAVNAVPPAVNQVAPQRPDGRKLGDTTWLARSILRRGINYILGRR